MRWASPWAFAFFILLFAILLWRWWSSQRKFSSLRLSSMQSIKMISNTWRVSLWRLALLFPWLAIAIMILALARPQNSNTQVHRNVEGIDIMLALDISDSMVIEDLKPSRMEAAKQIMQDFVKKRVSDRIGVTVFSGDSYTRVPLTLDYPLLLDNISKIQSSQNIKIGTAIGVGLANAVARLKDSTAKSRVIIFLTDGENNTGTIDPETGIEIAKGYNIRVYSIGIGIDGEAMLPIIGKDIFGRPTKHYQPMHSAVNDDLLNKMASETGGKYYRATNTTALENVFKDIDHLEKSKIDIHQYTKYTELFASYLQWALLVYLLWIVIHDVWLRRVP